MVSIKRERGDSFDSMDTNTSMDEIPVKKTKFLTYFIVSTTYENKHFSTINTTSSSCADNDLLLKLTNEPNSITLDAFASKHDLDIVRMECHTCPGDRCGAMIPTEKQMCGDFTCLTQDAINDEVAVLIATSATDKLAPPHDYEIPAVETPPPLTIRIPCDPVKKLMLVVKCQSVIRGFLQRNKYTLTKRLMKIEDALLDIQQRMEVIERSFGFHDRSEMCIVDRMTAIEAHWCNRLGTRDAGIQSRLEFIENEIKYVRDQSAAVRSATIPPSSRVNRDKSATVIQCIFRGYRVRSALCVRSAPYVAIRTVII